MDDWDQFVDIETHVSIKDVTPIKTIIKKSPIINPDNIKIPEDNFYRHESRTSFYDLLFTTQLSVHRQFFCFLITAILYLGRLTNFLDC